jgi:hypothetical protein
MEALERRAMVMFVVIALLVVQSFHIAPIQTRWLALFLIGLSCLAAASVLLVVAVAPAEYVGPWDSERNRSRLLFYAYALIAADVLITLALLAYQAYLNQAGSF